MTTEIIRTDYECDICGSVYGCKKMAEKCESRPISQDKGVNIGDEILITRGSGCGNATVESTHIKDMEWGHYAADRYWHTVSVVAKCANGYGSRNLTFDDYEVVEK